MKAPSAAEQIFDLAIRIQLCEKKMLELNFFPHHIRVLLPPKRMLAESGAVPMSKITSLLSEMEENQFIQAEQRGGMWTTNSGNSIIAGLLAGKYRNEAAGILGTALLEILLRELVDSAER